ncbi:MAG: hypothetical protein FJZ64_01775 [Chlamydiae bacterium]|nr:hypothetical protein [Chlamydiota bacterium]
MSKDVFSLNTFESLMQRIDFKVFRLGDPAALVCRRPDCLFMIDSEGNFTLSEADSEQTLENVINQIKTGMEL